LERSLEATHSTGARKPTCKKENFEQAVFPTQSSFRWQKNNSEHDKATTYSREQTTSSVGCVLDKEREKQKRKTNQK
jgi:hypothetical protein